MFKQKSYEYMSINRDSRVNHRDPLDLCQRRMWIEQTNLAETARVWQNYPSGRIKE